MGTGFDTRLLSGVGVLSAVIDSGSFVRAAETLGMSDSGVSRAVSRLEARIGIRLLDRTTRSLRLTDEGARFYERVAPLLAGIEEAATEAAGASAAIRGRLRVDVDAFLGRTIIAPRLPDFLAAHPGLSVELTTRQSIGDLVSDGIDLGLRFGTPTAASTVSRKLLDTHVLTVASPAYLGRRGRPAQPSDLTAHACIMFRDPASGRPFEWEFHREGEVVPVPVGGPLTIGEIGTMLEACLAGVGIAQMLGIGIADHLAAGRLVNLFPDWGDETFPLHAVLPSRHFAPAKTRAFLDFVAGLLADAAADQEKASRMVHPGGASAST
ncbi:LysR family transcriptional regulator [Methylobacterium gnaphalii]|uniref:LysR family transcriptional regulator n=1 Tax=Methylobacterium gnaphalii TaxID=1010610 RepID=A0A512JGH7_9HYPH|nr:LysR family transcriptional regulator [Methylobacterium gnaphalii]GEP09065.1 LysR family transcriptional regulator [Methylobacterium gnaphalii]GJD68377.1 HTH-type transcriptional regulator DmlR [Methylobacterium gnaphalii]GLS48989.1 LysR family transcriptional regulator [Methylobacterium gnaphalii]